MKKILIFIIGMCILLSGCSYSGAGLVQNANGSIYEYYYVSFPEKELMLAMGVGSSELRMVLSDIKVELDTEYFEPLINDYQKSIEQSEDYTIQEKIALVEGVTYSSNLPNSDDLVVGYFEEIRYQISFANSTCYAEFKKANTAISEEKIVEVKSNLFTTTTIVKKDPIFNTSYENAVSVGKYFIDLTNEKMTYYFGQARWQSAKNILNYEQYSSVLNYSYIVPTARLHSNADRVEKSSSGYYYHTWEVNLEQEQQEFQIQYWTTTANKPVWYALILLASGVVIASVYLIGKHKDKTKHNDIEKI